MNSNIGLDAPSVEWSAQRRLLDRKSSLKCKLENFFICDRAKLLCLCLYPWLSKATDCLSAFIAFHHRFDIPPHATSSLTSPRFLFLHGIRTHKEISFSYFDERCRPFPSTLNCLLLVVVSRARKATHNTLYGKSHTRKLKGWHNSCFNSDGTLEMKKCLED